MSLFGARHKGKKLSVENRNKIVTFYDFASDEIGLLIEYFEKKALHIQNSQNSAQEESNFPTARSTVSALKACRLSVANMKSDIVSGQYDSTLLEERTHIMAEYLGLCDKEAKVMGSDGIVGAQCAFVVLEVNNRDAPNQ